MYAGRRVLTRWTVVGCGPLLTGRSSIFNAEASTAMHTPPALGMQQAQTKLVSSQTSNSSAITSSTRCTLLSQSLRVGKCRSASRLAPGNLLKLVHRSRSCMYCIQRSLQDKCQSTSLSLPLESRHGRNRGAITLREAL